MMGASALCHFTTMPPIIKNAECRLTNIPRNLSPIKVIRYQRPKINLFQLHKRPVPYHTLPSHKYIPKESNAEEFGR